MNSKWTKRLIAYLFDFFLLFFLLIIVGLLFPNNDMINLQKEMTTIEQNYLFNVIDQARYYELSFNVMAEMFRESMLTLLLNIMFIIIYFIFIPFINSKQTLGMKIMNIKIASNNGKPITLSDLVLRNVITNGLGYLLLSLGIYYILPSNTFIITVSILGIIQLLLVIISSFMIIYKHDRRGIQDLISNTKVIDC